MFHEIGEGVGLVSQLRSRDLPPDWHVDPLDDGFIARQRLARLANDEFAMSALRRVYAEYFGSFQVTQLDRYQILASLGAAIAAGRLRIAHLQHVLRPCGGGTGPKKTEPPDVPEIETRHWVALRVIDDETSEPLAGVRLLIRESNGSTREYVTRSDGMVEIEPVRPAECDLLRVVAEDHLEVVRVE